MSVPAPQQETEPSNGLNALLAEEAHLSSLIRRARTSADTGAEVTAEIYLQVLGIRAAITQTLAWGCQNDIRDAIEAGATWPQIAHARGITPDQARHEFRRWVQAQGALWDSGTDPTGHRHGLNPRARRSVIALADRDLHPIPQPAGSSPLPKRTLVPTGRRPLPADVGPYFRQHRLSEAPTAAAQDPAPSATGTSPDPDPPEPPPPAPT